MTYNRHLRTVFATGDFILATLHQLQSYQIISTTNLSWNNEHHFWDVKADQNSPMPASLAWFQFYTAPSVLRVKYDCHLSVNNSVNGTDSENSK